jgi:hypothetical protein
MELVGISQGAVEATELRGDGIIVAGGWCVLEGNDERPPMRDYERAIPWPPIKTHGYKVIIPGGAVLFFKDLYYIGRSDEEGGPKEHQALHEAMIVAIREARRKKLKRIYVAFQSRFDIAHAGGRRLFPKAKHLRAAMPMLEADKRKNFESLLTERCKQLH